MKFHAKIPQTVITLIPKLLDLFDNNNILQIKSILSSPAALRSWILSLFTPSLSCIMILSNSERLAVLIDCISSKYCAKFDGFSAGAKNLPPSHNLNKEELSRRV